MTHTRPAALAALLLLLFCGLAQADAGLDAYRRGDYAAAAAAWRPAAERGDAFAQYQMGYLHEMGRGVNLDPGEARRWYEQAQQQGYAPAARALERMASMPEAPTPAARPAPVARPSGPPIAPSPSAPAISAPVSRALPAAAAPGKGPICREAPAALSAHPRQRTLAQGWCDAADKGDPQALYALGHVMASAGVFQQGEIFTLAEKYWTQALNLEHPQAQTALGVLYARNGEATGRWPEAVRLLQASADRGDALAMYNLGALRYNGKAVPQDIARALKSWMRAAELGNLQATMAMAWEYCSGRNLATDLTRGENLLATVRRMDPRIGRTTCVEWAREPTPWGAMSYDYPAAGFEVP